MRKPRSSRLYLLAAGPVLQALIEIALRMPSSRCPACKTSLPRAAETLVRHGGGGKSSNFPYQCLPRLRSFSLGRGDRFCTRTLSSGTLETLRKRLASRVKLQLCQNIQRRIHVAVPVYFRRSAAPFWVMTFAGLDLTDFHRSDELAPRFRRGVFFAHRLAAAMARRAQRARAELIKLVQPHQFPVALQLRHELPQPMRKRQFRTRLVPRRHRRKLPVAPCNCMPFYRRGAPQHARAHRVACPRTHDSAVHAQPFHLRRRLDRLLTQQFLD